MSKSQRMMVNHMGRDYMRIQVGDSFRFIEMAGYDGPTPSSMSSTSQVQEDHVSTRQHSAQSNSRDEDLVFIRSQSVSAPSANVLQPQSLNRQSQRLRDAVNHERTLSAPSIPSSSTKRRYSEIDDDVVATSGTQNAKRMKRMRRTSAYPDHAASMQYQGGEYPVEQTQNGYKPRQYAEAAHGRQPRYSQQMHSSQQKYKPQRMPSSQNFLHLQQPAYPVDTPELQHSSQIYPLQQTQNHHYGVPPTYAGIARSQRRPEQASPSPQMPTAHQEWLLQQPPSLHHIYSQQKTYLPQHQHHVQQTYPRRNAPHSEQVPHSQDVQYHEHKYQSPSSSHSVDYRSNQAPSAHNVQQHVQKPRQRSLATPTASRASNRQKTSTSTRQDETSTQGAMQGDASVCDLRSTSSMPKPVMRADKETNHSATALVDQTGRFDRASMSLQIELPPHPVSGSSVRSVKESTLAEAPMMPSTTKGERKSDLEEDGFAVTEAPTKWRKTAVTSRTHNGEEYERPEEVHAKSPRHESSEYVSDDTINEDPGSAEYGLKYFTPWQLATVGPDSLMAWFTAKQLKSHFSPIILHQIFSVGHLNLLRMRDILEYSLPEGTMPPPPGTSLDPALFETPQLQDSELEEIQRGIFASITPEAENYVVLGDDGGSNPLFDGEMLASTIDENVGADDEFGQSISVHDYAQPSGLEETAIIDAREESTLPGNVNAGKSKEGDVRVIGQQQPADKGNCPSESERGCHRR